MAIYGRKIPCFCLSSIFFICLCLGLHNVYERVGNGSDVFIYLFVYFNSKKIVILVVLVVRNLRYVRFGNMQEQLNGFFYG